MCYNEKNVGVRILRPGCPCWLAVPSLLSLVALAGGFSSELCSHKELQDTLTGFEGCFQQQPARVDICSHFDQMDVCVPRHFGY